MPLDTKDIRRSGSGSSANGVTATPTGAGHNNPDTPIELDSSDVIKTSGNMLVAVTDVYETAQSAQNEIDSLNSLSSLATAYTIERNEP